MTTSSVAQAAGVARQTAHVHLKAEVAAGSLEQIGKGPATRYRRRAVTEVFGFGLDGLQEDEVLKKIRAASALVPRLNANASSIFDFVLTEMVNNAIDHSGGSQVHIRLIDRPATLVTEIEDDGEGVFQHVQSARHLQSPMEAVQDLSKGKVTTDPERHTGQGIFFTSRAVESFTLESGTLRWIVNNAVEDVALGQIARRRGTLVRAELAYATARSLKDVFDAYSDDNFAFSKTRTWIRLFETGLGFVSRSEAKRLLIGLEQFEEAVLDFKGVSAVGQGFADEVFRVWARSHPHVRLTPINMDEAVTFMVERARRDVQPR